MKMDERLKKEVIKIPDNSAGEVLSGFVPKDVLDIFKNLSVEVQDGIVAYIKSQREAGRSAEEILSRLEVLIRKGEELENIPEINPAGHGVN